MVRRAGKAQRAHHSSAAVQEMVGTSPTLLCPRYDLGPVIASEAKQSISPRKERMECFVASLLAMTEVSVNLEPYRQLFRAIDKIGLRHLDLAVEGDRFQPRQQFLEQDAHLELGQILPEAEMRAVAE